MTSPDPWWATHTPGTPPAAAPSRHARARRWLRRLTTAGAAVGAFALIATTGDIPDVRDAGNGLAAHKQTTNALIGGCGPLYRHTTPPASVSVPATDTEGRANWQRYTTIVPMVGPYWDTPLPPGRTYWGPNATNPPAAEALLAQARTGALIVFYTAQVPTEELNRIRAYQSAYPRHRVLAAPWDEPVRGRLPQGREIAFMTWNASQTCHQFVSPALVDFRRATPASQAPDSPAPDRLHATD